DNCACGRQVRCAARRCRGRSPTAAVVPAAGRRRDRRRIPRPRRRRNGVRRLELCDWSCFRQYSCQLKAQESLQDSQDQREPPMEEIEIEQVVRTRLRSLRTTLGLSLHELAARTDLSPSTISRVETGKRTISLDVLIPLAR